MALRYMVALFVLVLLLCVLGGAAASPPIVRAVAPRTVMGLQDFDGNGAILADEMGLGMSHACS